MKKKKNTTRKTLSLLLEGKIALAKKYAGKHVLVVKDKVILLKKGEAGWNEFLNLEEKFGEPPVLTYIPSKDITYILYV